MKNLDFLSRIVAAETPEEQLELARAEQQRLFAEFETIKEKRAAVTHIVRLLETETETTPKTQSHE